MSKFNAEPWGYASGASIEPQDSQAPKTFAIQTIEFWLRMKGSVNKKCDKSYERTKSKLFTLMHILNIII
ncbi:MAG: hypothetical protein COB46_10385 [Rhodospirillaceae bacterium]|nr:MAG: hypothetical protein COB46_10385 [Rhodospirillaceae bacterium]